MCSIPAAISTVKFVSMSPSTAAKKQIAAAVGSASKVKYYLPLVWHASSQFVEITAAVTSHNARRLGLVRRGCFNSG